MIVALLATLIDLQKVFEKFLVIRVTLLNEDLCQKYDFAVARHLLHSSLVILKHIDKRVEESKADLLHRLDGVTCVLSSVILFEGLLDLSLQELFDFGGQNRLHPGLLRNVVAFPLKHYSLRWFLDNVSRAVRSNRKH